MGNDAAHNIQPADLGGLLIALKIVEHLIISLYILDHDADGVLETVIKTYDVFQKHLNEQLATIPQGNELPLLGILGRSARRFHGYLKSHEQTLISSITAGSYICLTLGKVDVVGSSKEKYQYYVKA